MRYQVVAIVFRMLFSIIMRTSELSSSYIRLKVKCENYSIKVQEFSISLCIVLFSPVGGSEML